MAALEPEFVVGSFDGIDAVQALDKVLHQELFDDGQRRIVGLLVGFVHPIERRQRRADGFLQVAAPGADGTLDHTAAEADFGRVESAQCKVGMGHDFILAVPTFSPQNFRLVDLYKRDNDTFLTILFLRSSLFTFVKSDTGSKAN